MTAKGNITYFSSAEINQNKRVEQTYKLAAEFIKDNFNLTRLGCLFYDIDFDTATTYDKKLISNKFSGRLKNPSKKTIDRIQYIIFPYIRLLSDQEIEELKRLSKEKNG